MTVLAIISNININMMVRIRRNICIRTTLEFRISISGSSNIGMNICSSIHCDYE